MATDAFIPLYSTTLAASTATVTIAGIPTTGYRDLRIVVQYQPSATANQMTMQLNADTGSNYSQVIMAGNGSVTQSSSSTSTNFSPVIMAAVPSTNWVVYAADIMDAFVTDKQKSVLIRSSHAGEVGALAGRWANTSAVTTITFNGAPNLNAGSIINVYGIVG